jgi:site-specific recombinase XerD
MTEPLVQYEEWEVDEQGPRLIVRPMLTADLATDLFLGDLQRRGCSKRTVDTYRRHLDKLCDRLPRDLDVAKITEDDCRRFLDYWNQKAPGTRAHAFSVMSSFFKWLYKAQKIKRNPMDRMDRPRRLPAEDLNVVTISNDDVRALLAAAQGWPQKLAVAVVAYMGPRRRAAALLRLKDYDRARGRIRFYEKGGKVIWKPVPHELARMLDAAIADGAIADADDYLIPSSGTLVRNGDRDDRVVWRLVKDAAARANVNAHVHSLRAAFAVFYLESHPGDIEGLKELMGHRSLATTQIYLRKLNRGQAMERVRDLNWNPS